MELLILFFVIVGGCTVIGKIFGKIIFPKSRDYSQGYVDRSTTIIHNHHYHDNRSVNVNGNSIKDLK